MLKIKQKCRIFLRAVIKLNNVTKSVRKRYPGSFFGERVRYLKLDRLSFGSWIHEFIIAWCFHLFGFIKLVTNGIILGIFFDNIVIKVYC